MEAIGDVASVAVWASRFTAYDWIPTPVRPLDIVIGAIELIAIEFSKKLTIAFLCACFHFFSPAPKTPSKPGLAHERQPGSERQCCSSEFGLWY